MQVTPIATLRTLLLAVPVIVAPIIVAPTTAHAQDNAANQAAAQGLFDEAMQLFGQEEFAAACKKFEASLQLVEGVGTRGKLAECYEKIGRTASAWAAYRAVAVLAGRTGQTLRQEVAEQRAAKLKPLLSYLTISLRSNSDTPGIEVTRNGSPVVSGSFGSPIAVDPGSYEIVTSAPGYETQNISVDVGITASQNIIIDGLIKSIVDTSNTELTQTTTSPVGDESTGKLIGLTTAGVGTLTVLGGVFLGLSAKSDYNSAFDSNACDSNNECTPAGKKTVEDARSKANIATFVSVSGFAIAGVGTYLWLRSRNKEREQQAVHLVPTITTESTGLSILGQF